SSRFKAVLSRPRHKPCDRQRWRTAPACYVRRAPIAMTRWTGFRHASAARSADRLGKPSRLLLDALFAALARGRDRARRKGWDGGEVCWQLARQALQKCHYVARFGFAQRHPELHPRHDTDGLWKRRHRPVVKIGRGHRDIPQAGNTENIKVVGVFGDI